MLGAREPQSAQVQSGAGDWAIPRTGTSPLIDADLDAVYSSLPNALHPSWRVAALRAGKQMSAGKPLTLDAQEEGLLRHPLTGMLPERTGS